MHKLRLFYNTNTRFAFGENYVVSLDFYNSFMAFITNHLKLDPKAIWINQMYNIDSRGTEQIQCMEFKREQDESECDEMYDTDNDSCISES